MDLQHLFRGFSPNLCDWSEKGKPEYTRTIKSSYNGRRLQSQALSEFLIAFYGAKVRLVNPDGNDEIEIQDYNTSSKVTTKDLLAEIRKHKAK